MKHPVSTKIFLDTRRAKSDGTYPVKLRLTFERDRVYYPTGHNLSQEDFDRAMGDRPRAEHKERAIQFRAMEARANEIIEGMSVFTFQGFDKLYKTTKKQNQGCAFGMLESYIESLRAEGRAKTANSYLCTLNSFKAFHGRQTLPFSEITVGYLQGYEQWMLQPKPVSKGKKTTMKANSATTVGIYLRSLRTVYNQAIAEKLVSIDAYPFGKRGYKIPAGQNIKKAITLEEIKLLFQFTPRTERESYFRDLWLFSYLCNGANMKDLARLKYGNIDGDTVTFVRSKTERSSKQNLKPIVCHYDPKARAIVERWGNKPAKPDSYVFPVLQPGDNADRELSLVQEMVKQVNKYIDRIAKAVGITQHVTTYTARHSFATVLKRSSAPISYISEALGHKDLKTTENYLGSFDSGTRKQYAASLTDFGE